MCTISVSIPNARVVWGLSSSARIGRLIGCSLSSGDVEEYLLELEALVGHLVDLEAGSGGGEADRVGDHVPGDHRVLRDLLAFRGEGGTKVALQSFRERPGGYS